MLSKRYQPLAAAHAVSQQTYQDAVAAEREAKADLETARVNLNYTQVRAPFSGHISRSLYTEGALVTSGQTDYLATIQQLDPIYVDVSESSADLLRLRRAQAEGKLEKVGDNEAAVRLQLEDGSEYPLEGKLAFSEVNVNEATGTVVLRLSSRTHTMNYYQACMSMPACRRLFSSRVFWCLRKPLCMTAKVSLMFTWCRRMTLWLSRV